MKKRFHDKKAWFAILHALAVIALAEVIFRAVALREFSFTTSNFGEQLAIIALAVIITVLTKKGKERACYICYGAWIGYFVLDQLFEIFGVILRVLNLISQEDDAVISGVVAGGIIRVAIMVCIIAIGVLLAEYMNDGTIYNRAFNGICIAAVLLLVVNIAISINWAVTVDFTFWLDTFHNLYSLTMIFLFTFFAYDSAKTQLKKTDLTE